MCNISCNKTDRLGLLHTSYRKPLYRTPNGSLVDIWKPVGDMSRPLVLEVGLVHNISMIPDPVPATGRYRIWDEVKF